MPIQGFGGSSTSQVTMRVEPDKILQLKRDLEDIRNEAVTFIKHEGRALTPRPMGADPVSHDVVDTIGENAETAIECTQNYADQLTKVINSLAEAAKQYGLVDEDAADAFGKPGA